MKQQISNIAIAAMFSSTALYGFGAFEKRQPSYATAHFEGGFKAIGEITEQRIVSNFRVLIHGKEIYAGDIQTVVTEIEKSLDGEKNPGDVSWKQGVRVQGDAGMQWTGSEGNFKITTHSMDLTSTGSAPLKPLEIIKRLEAMITEIKSQHNKYVRETIVFSERP
ncbi:MAG TPA: hypothetical protein VNV36_15250 [Pseudomonas sp.]|uniref:hypothetical protein n=1 Tax=Pseudomonas sp. TaxID=306 RepID=UPI002C5A5A9B|nr:hypothetical protein [Pseudomonas sp.]HWH88116.1 hypothetical protein [Pseudomonas sp.]